MRFVLALFTLLVAAFTTTASLIARQTLPSCAISCLANANTGSCGPEDDTCLCNDQAFVNSTTVCIESSCSGSDLANAEAYSQQLCLAAGVTLTAAGSATPTSTTTSATSSSTAKSSSSGAPTTNSISILAGAVAALAIGAIL